MLKITRRNRSPILLCYRRVRGNRLLGEKGITTAAPLTYKSFKKCKKLNQKDICDFKVPEVKEHKNIKKERVFIAV